MLCKQSISPKTFGSFTQKNFNFSPPPPPDGRPDRWDLQFCRFWGWNWVLRSEVNEGKVEQLAMTNALKRSTENQRKKSSGRQKAKRKDSTEVVVGSGRLQPLPTKEQLRELCKCIFKPQKKYLSSCIKDGFQTPSQTTLQWKSKCCAKKIRESKKPDPVSSCSADGTKCSQQGSTSDNSFIMVEMTASLEEIKESKAKLTYSGSADRPAEKVPQYTADKEVHCRRSCLDEAGSTTDGSVEYVSLRVMNGGQCCSCCHDTRRLKSTNDRGVDKKASVSKNNLEVQTSQSPKIKCPSVDNKDTQTPSVTCKTVEVSAKSAEEKLIKLKKKKVICLCVCCCACCRQDAKSSNGQRSDEDESRCSKCHRRRFDPNEQVVPEKQTPFTVKKTNVSEKAAPLEESDPDPSKISYNTVIAPPNTKAFSKFGTPSKSYSWMKGVTSDNTDSSLSQYQFYKSPLTGKTYDLSSVNIDDQFKLTLPDAIDVSDDLVYLKQLDKSWKSDKESRLVLDAVCDAIISEHEDNIKREQVNDLMLNDRAPAGFKDCAKAGYEVRKLNNIFDEIFNLIPPSDDEHDNAFFAVSRQGFQWKPDTSIKNMPSIKKHQKAGKKRSLDHHIDEHYEKKRSFNHQTDEYIGKAKSEGGITGSKIGEVTKSGNKIDDIFAKIGTIVKEDDKAIEKIKTPLGSVSQSSKSFQTHPKTYPMSSDIVKNDLTLFEPRPSEQESKKSYEIFSSDRNSFIVTEESAVLSENHKQADDLDNIISEELLKINRLSVQSFLVCDKKSSESRSTERSDLLAEKRSSKKKKSNSSLIPIRRRRH